MNRIFENQRSGIDLMVWPVSPADRVGEITIKFYKEEHLPEVVKGDCIVDAYFNSAKSGFVISEIIESRDGAMHKRKYVTATATHSNSWNPSEFDTEFTGNRFKQYFGIN